MNIFSEPLGDTFLDLTQDAYRDALCNVYSVRLCSVSGYGSCFFDSIFALLPTAGKAVKSSKALRLSCVEFFRQCFQGQHGFAGERILDDINFALNTKIVSSVHTRYSNRAPKTVEKYFEAASKSSVWVEGVQRDCVYTKLHSLPVRIPLAQSCLDNV